NSLGETRSLQTLLMHVSVMWHALSIARAARRVKRARRPRPLSRRRLKAADQRGQGPRRLSRGGTIAAIKLDKLNGRALEYLCGFQSGIHASQSSKNIGSETTKAHKRARTERMLSYVFVALGGSS